MNNINIYFIMFNMSVAWIMNYIWKIRVYIIHLKKEKEKILQVSLYAALFTVLPNSRVSAVMVA